MSYARHTASRNFKKVSRTSGDITLNGNSWQEIAAESGGPGTTGFDLTLWAQVGDEISCWMQAAVDGLAVALYFDVHTVVAGSTVNSFGSGGTVSGLGLRGVGGWYASPSREDNVGGAPLFYTLVAGDLVASGGATKVTVRPMFRGASATNRTLYANSATGPTFAFYAMNLGPAQT